MEKKIGLIGLTIAGKTKNASRPNDDTLFLDEAASAQAEIDRLKAQGVNKIIIQSHYGYQQDQALAKKLNGVDVIIGGDSHSLLAPASLSTYGITPEGDYPTKTTDKDGKPVCIAQAWQYAYVVGELKVSFDKDGVVSNCEGTPHLLIGNDFKLAAPTTTRSALTTAELSSIKADIHNSKLFKIVSPDQHALDVLASYSVAKTLFGEQQVAVAPQTLCLRRVPGIHRDISRSSAGDICNKANHVNQHGGDVQQLVAEAFLQQGKSFFNADLSIQNGGGVRIDLPAKRATDSKLPANAVTVGDIYTVLPFKNTLVQLKMTGAEVKATLEDAIDGVVAGGSGGYPYTGGLRWQVDLNKAKGQRLSKLELRDATGNYQAFDLSKTYNVITINFLADGQDGYTTLGTITGDRRVEVGLDYAEAFLKYVDELQGTNGRLLLLNKYKPH
jgi:5'-nucleotidase/UDP-sugar diphosphatase